MKSDHRHELKTNELADWIAHFPQWAKENRTTLIVAGAVLVVALGVYFWRFYRNASPVTRQQVRLTGLVTELPAQADRIVAGQADAISLMPIAEDLQDFARTARSDSMAAMALIKRAEALRAELYYRRADAAREEKASQIAQAQSSYREALERGASVPALAATAHFGLGLCEEELGNFDEAREIYQQVADETSYRGTPAQAAAAHRLKTMDDYRTRVVFKPAPDPPATPATPDIQVEPNAFDLPSMIQPVPDEPIGPALPTDDEAGDVGTAEDVPDEMIPIVPMQDNEAAGQTPDVQTSEANAPAMN